MPDKYETTSKMSKQKLDALLVYGDEYRRENLRYVSNFWPIFERGACVIPFNSDRYQYKLLLDPGLWERVSVVWFPADLLGLREIGSYFIDPENQERPLMCPAKTRFRCLGRWTN